MHAGVTTGAPGARSKAARPNGRCSATTTTAELRPQSTRWCTWGSTPARPTTIPWRRRRSSSRPPPSSLQLLRAPIITGEPLKIIMTTPLLLLVSPPQHHHQAALIVLAAPAPITPLPPGLMSPRRSRTTSPTGAGCSASMTAGPQQRLLRCRRWKKIISPDQSGHRCTSPQRMLVGRLRTITCCCSS